MKRKLEDFENEKSALKWNSKLNLFKNFKTIKMKLKTYLKNGISEKKNGRNYNIDEITLQEEPEKHMKRMWCLWQKK